MTQLTRDVVSDLWPLYAAGEASDDTRALVEAFLGQDAEFAERLHDESAAELLRSGAIEPPADHERATLLRTQRRRALQSMVVNALALLVSAAMTAVCLWLVVPRYAVMFHLLGSAMPSVMRFTISAANWTLRLLPLAILALPAVWLARRRIRLPEVVRSGTALAAATGTVLLLVQAGWLALLVESSTVILAPFRAGMADEPRVRAQIAMRVGDYGTAIQQLRLSQDRLGRPDSPWLKRQALFSALVTGDAWRASGEHDRAKACYEDALRLARELAAAVGSAEAAQLDAAVRSALEGLANERARRAGSPPA